MHKIKLKLLTHNIIIQKVETSYLIIIVYITATCFGRVELTSTDNLSNYTADWRGRGNRVEFVLTGRGQGWVGIGFSENRIMVMITFVILIAKHFVTD